MSFEFRIFLPILDANFTREQNLTNYLATDKFAPDNILPGSWQYASWEDRTDEYLNAQSSLIGVKSRGGKKKVEIKINSSDNNKLNDERNNFLVEKWKKYKLSVRKKPSCAGDLIGYHSEFREILELEGCHESTWDKLLSSSGTLMSVRKRRKNIAHDSVILEICTIESIGNSGIDWLSVAIEGPVASDITEFITGSYKNSSGPSIWGSVLVLLDYIRKEGSEWVPMPIISGYPMLLQYIDGLVPGSNRLDQRQVDDDAMNRLLFFESLLSVKDETTPRKNPYQRCWRRSSGGDKKSPHTFQVLSWNMQAANLRGNALPSKSFAACETILNDIKNGIGSDTPPHLISLQEMQLCKNQINNMCQRYCKATKDSESNEFCQYDHASRVLSTLHSCGYEGSFHKKLKWSVGLFWKADTFLLCKNFFVNFKTGSKFGTGAVLALLEHKMSRQKVLAIALQLSPVDSSGSRVVMEELTQLFLKIDEIFKQYGTFPLVLAGDFNSVVARSEKCPSAKAYDWLTTTIGLSSAYQTVCGHEPMFTSVDPAFPCCIDYIFYSSSPLLHPVAVFDCIPSNELDSVESVIRRLPSHPWPSDHIPIVAEFELIPAAEDATQSKQSKIREPSGCGMEEQTFSFFAIGDFGEPNQMVKKVAQSMAQLAARSPLKFILSLGDNIYDDGCESVDDPQFNTKWVDIFITPYRALHVPWKICLGNHDYYGSPASQIDYTYHPSNPKKLWQCPSNVYQFRVNGCGEEVSAEEEALVEFFCMDTNGYFIFTHAMISNIYNVNSSMAYTSTGRNGMSAPIEE